MAAMARPKNADAVATRARILAAARGLFAKRGLGGTSTREIAKMAGVSVATLHHHFGNKETLHDAATNSMWSGMGSVQKAFIHAIDEDDDLAMLVDKCVRVAFAYAREQRDGARLLMRRVVEQGALTIPNGTDAEQTDLLAPFIGHAATLIAAATGRRDRKVRLEISSVVFLIARYALADTAQIGALLDLDLTGANEDQLIDALEEHLVEASLGILSIERDDSAATQGK